MQWRPIARLAWALIFLPLAVNAAQDISKARRDIDGITKRLNDLDAWFSDATRRQRDLQKELRSTDQSIAGTSSDIRQIEDELKRLGKELTGLAEQMKQLNEQRDEQAQLVASHLAAAYRLSGEDFLKLVLNQQNPEQLDRMVHYHRYFSAARTEALTEYQVTLTEIAANAEATRSRERSCDLPCISVLSDTSNRSRPWRFERNSSRSPSRLRCCSASACSRLRVASAFAAISVSVA